MTIVAVPMPLAADAVRLAPQPAAALAQGQALQNQAPQNQAPQNLVEYLATMNPGPQASGASPAQLGEHMITNLKGFFDRSSTMTSRARALSDRAPAPQVAMTLVHGGPARQALDPSAMPLGPQPAKGSVDGQQMDRVIEALGLMFDYSIETQLVVRGATQVSGAANTLLRGQ